MKRAVLTLALLATVADGCGHSQAAQSTRRSPPRPAASKTAPAPLTPAERLGLPAVRAQAALFPAT